MRDFIISQSSRLWCCTFLVAGKSEIYLASMSKLNLSCSHLHLLLLVFSTSNTVSDFLLSSSTYRNVQVVAIEMICGSRICHSKSV